MKTAHEIEVEKWKGVAELEAMKAKIEKARAIAAAEAASASAVGTAPGMKVDLPTGAEVEEEDANAEPLPPKKMPARKTKQQRKKAERLRAEVLFTVPAAPYARSSLSMMFVETSVGREGGAETHARLR